MASWAGNVDRSLMLGHAQHGAALLALEIAMRSPIPVLVALQRPRRTRLGGHTQIRGALALPLRNIAGKGSDNRPYDQRQRKKIHPPQHADTGQQQQRHARPRQKF